jgi:hypothetical protein
MPISEFTIVPYVGAMPITFGMDRARVASLLGNPSLVKESYLGETTEYREGNRVSVKFSKSDERVVEMGFCPGVILSYDGETSLLDDPDVISTLILRDPNPHETNGIIVFLGLGSTVTGFHDQDSPQKAITIFERGRWDPNGLSRKW